MVPMGDQQMGERLGRLEEKQDGLDRRMVEVKEGNEADHGEVKGLLTEIRDEMAKKADKAEVKAVADRTDKLESRSDKLMAIVGLVVLLCTVAPGLLILLTGGH
jgi:hypothetical protein